MVDKASPYDLNALAIERSKQATTPRLSPYTLSVNYSLHANKKDKK